MHVRITPVTSCILPLILHSAAGAASITVRIISRRLDTKTTLATSAMPDHNVPIPTLSASETFYPPTDRRTPRCAHHESDADPIYATCNQRKVSRNNGTRLLLPYLPESLVSLRPLVDEFTLEMARLGLVLKDQLHLNAEQIQHLGQQ